MFNKIIGKQPFIEVVGTNLEYDQTKLETYVAMKSGCERQWESQYRILVNAFYAYCFQEADFIRTQTRFLSVILLSQDPSQKAHESPRPLRMFSGIALKASQSFKNTAFQKQIRYL